MQCLSIMLSPQEDATLPKRKGTNCNPRAGQEERDTPEVALDVMT